MLAMKEIRERLGLTQAAVARELGVSRQTYNNWELGKRQADYEYLLRLGELFETSVENILTGCLEPTVPKELLPYKMNTRGPVIEAEIVEAETKEKSPLKGSKDFFRELFSDLTESEIDDLTKYACFLRYLRTHSEE